MVLFLPAPASSVSVGMRPMLALPCVLTAVIPPTISWSSSAYTSKEVIMKYFFILGARDPEMLEIARVLEAHGHPYTNATISVLSAAPGRSPHGESAGPSGHAKPRRRRKTIPVRSNEAYHATGVQGLIPKDHRLVFVECSVFGLWPDEICDHHNEGDPGYGQPPERYLEGSSLGQVLSLLGLEPTKEQRIIAAADHCLRHAYAGRCPGVDPEELAAWRERSRAEVRGITVEEIRARIEAAMEALRKAPRITVAGEEVAWFPAGSGMPEEIPEASARLGIPFCYTRREGGRGKSGIMSAPPHVIEAWMRECGLKDVYGDPARGFAGGYL